MDNAKQRSQKVTRPAGCLHLLCQLIYKICETVTAKVTEPLPLSEQTLVVPTPAPQRWQKALDVATAPFANPAHTEVMLAHLNDFLAERRASVRFSNHTGLVRSLRGELYPGQKAASAEDMLAISEEFLHQYGAALHGSEEDYQWHADSQMIIGSCVRLRQTDQSGIPLYGGTMIFGFNDNGQLSMVNSSWYAIPPEASYEQSFKLTWEEARDVALEHVRTHFLPEAQSHSKSPTETPPLAETPPPTKEDWDLEVIPGDELKEGRIILPQFDEDEEAAEDPYRPAWVALVINRPRSRSWEVHVDAENGQVLAAADATVGATIRACVHLNNAQALDDKTEVRDLNGDISTGKLADAPHFKMEGKAFKEPSQPGDDCQSVELTDDGFRSANVYYHLYHALQKFVNKIAKNAWSAAPAVPTMPGEKENDKVSVNMLLGEGDGRYDPVTCSISFGHGLSSPSGEDQEPFVKDPARDCEVIYHEYTHAALHVVQPDLFHFPKKLPYLFMDAINEGVAFYFGCTLSERPHPEQSDTADTQPYCWGEFSYGASVWAGFRDLQREDLTKQEPEYDYLPAYGVFPCYAGGCKDPVKDGKEYYALGMLWARALWDVRRALGYDIADAIILRGLSLAGGVQSELETPAEAIIHTDGEYTNGGPPHESALRLIFCSRGIMADAPIHDLIEIELGEEGEKKTYVLAATENTSGNNAQPGCMFSDDRGDHWYTLGTSDPAEDGPAEVVALAAAKVSETKAIIWAASEHRVKVEDEDDGDNVISTARVYRYDLEVDSSGGGINTGDPWQKLKDLPDKKVNVLSLAAAKKPNGTADECWLFAGTEKGLYKYDGHWDSVPSVPLRRQVFDLAITTVKTVNDESALRLLVATHHYLYVLDLTSLARDSELKADYVLTVAAGDGQGHIWAGTAFEGIYHFDPNNGEWEQDSTIDSRPVHCLLVKQGVSYAGTNDGVYRRVEGEGWEPFNDTSHQNAEAIEATSVVALSRAKDRLLAGTAQRGLWGRESANEWVRLTEGLPRIGRLTDATAPSDTCDWSHEFTNDDLPKDGVGTHVFYVPNSDCGSLSVKVEEGNVVEPALYYVAPHINLGEDYGAGLQTRTLDNTGKMVETAQQGFYLLAVTAKSKTDYEITVTLKGG